MGSHTKRYPVEELILASGEVRHNSFEKDKRAKTLNEHYSKWVFTDRAISGGKREAWLHESFLPSEVDSNDPSELLFIDKFFYSFRGDFNPSRAEKLANLFFSVKIPRAAKRVLNKKNEYRYIMHPISIYSFSRKETIFDLSLADYIEDLQAMDLSNEEIYAVFAYYSNQQRFYLTEVDDTVVMQMFKDAPIEDILVKRASIRELAELSSELKYYNIPLYFRIYPPKKHAASSASSLQLIHSYFPNIEQRIRLLPLIGSIVNEKSTLKLDSDSKHLLSHVLSALEFFDNNRSIDDTFFALSVKEQCEVINQLSSDLSESESRYFRLKDSGLVDWDPLSWNSNLALVFSILKLERNKQNKTDTVKDRDRLAKVFIKLYSLIKALKSKSGWMKKNKLTDSLTVRGDYPETTWLRFSDPVLASHFINQMIEKYGLEMFTELDEQWKKVQAREAPIKSENMRHMHAYSFMDILANGDTAVGSPLDWQIDLYGTRLARKLTSTGERIE